MDKAGSATETEGAAAPARPASPTWRFLISPRWLAWHAFAVVAFWGMFWLGDWQFHRALAGNGLSWAYTFEWPIFAIMGAIFWGKTIRDEFQIRGGRTAEAAEPDLPAGAAGPDGLPTTAGSISGGAAEPEDPELAAYNAYLAKLNAEVKGPGRRHGLR
jgi:hypothetical protein